MTIEEKKSIIKNHPVFQGLDDATITFVAERVKFKVYSPDTVIIQQGDEPDAVYFTYSGLYNVYLINASGKYIPVKTSEEQDFVGDLAAVDREPYPSTIETLKETHVFILPRKDFTYSLQNFPGMAHNLLQAWAKKVRIINKQREISLSLELSDRTLIVLQTLSHHFPDKTITLTHEEISHIVGATRARVTEVLHELEKQQLISLSTHKITVL